MLVAVKTPPIEIRGEAIPRRFIDEVKHFFGDDCVAVVLEDAGDDAIITPETSMWYQELEATLTPGDAMRAYRQIHELTQAALGEKLGGIARGEISKMETGKRNISLKTARKLAKVFDVPVSRFV